MVLGKIPEILKISLILVLIIRGHNQETDGEGLSLGSGLGQSLKAEIMVI